MDDGAAHLQPGYILDRYELLCPVGSGGMASVWLARMQGKRGFEKLFAIKTIRTELSDDPRFEEMFLDEARIASGIQHPNVAQVLDLGEQDGVLFTVIEWVDGESLAKVQKVAAKNGELLPLGVVLRIVADACAGLHAAHELRDASGAALGIVHRDVSPHNILISTSGGVKVIDFGLAKATNRLAPRTQSGLLKGKLEYMSPEQVLAHDVDRRADVWAMGICLYEMIAGERPFVADNQLELARRITTTAPPDIPNLAEPIRQLLIGALAPDPEERFESAAAMRKRVELTISAMELPSTSEEVATFVATHLAERAKKRADTVARALEDAARRGGSLAPRAGGASGSMPPPPGAPPAGATPVGIRVSARAMLEQDVRRDSSSSSAGASLGGAVSGSSARPLTGARPAWVLPVAGAALVGIALAAIVRSRSHGDVQNASIGAASSGAASVSVAAPVSPPPSASSNATGAGVAFELPASGASDAAAGAPHPAASTGKPHEPGAAGPTHEEPPNAAPHASASAAPTSTWGLIPPTTPTIWKPAGSDDAAP